MESEREKLIALLKIRDANGELLYGEQGELNYESIVDVVMPFILAREAELTAKIAGLEARIEALYDVTRRGINDR